MNFKSTRAFAMVALCLAAFAVQGCAEERDPINRVQPDALAKSFFVGDDLINDKDNPDFYANGTLLDIQLSTQTPLVAPSDTLSPAEGLEWETPTSGLTVDTVAPDSQANAAGISAGDRLLRINGVAVQDADQARDVLSPEREVSVFVELERDGRRWGVLLPNPEDPEAIP